MDNLNKDTDTGGASNTSSPVKKKSVAEVVQLTSIIAYSLNQASKTTKPITSNGNGGGDGDGDDGDDETRSVEENKKAQEVSGLFPELVQESYPTIYQPTNRSIMTCV